MKHYSVLMSQPEKKKVLLIDILSLVSNFFFKQILPYYESWHKQVTIVESSTARDSIYLESAPCILINCSARFLRNNVHLSVLLRNGQTTASPLTQSEFTCLFRMECGFCLLCKKDWIPFYCSWSLSGRSPPQHCLWHVYWWVSWWNRNIAHQLGSPTRHRQRCNRTWKKKSRRQLYRNQTTKNAVFEFHLLMIRLPNPLGWEVCKPSWP